MCRQENWRLSSGTSRRDCAFPAKPTPRPSTPAAATPWRRSARSTPWHRPTASAILVLVNFHRFLQSAEIVQALEQQINAGKQNRTFIIVLSPLVQIPCELERAFCVVEHDLPDRPQLEAIARGIATQEGELPEGNDLGAVLDAACGMTRCEAENAFALSLVRHRRLEAGTIWQLKAAELKKSNLLTLHRGGETFADLGGLDALKSFCVRGAAAQAGRQAQGPGNRLGRAAGNGKVRNGQGTWSRNGPARR